MISTADKKKKSMFLSIKWHQIKLSSQAKETKKLIKHTHRKKKNYISECKMDDNVPLS